MADTLSTYETHAQADADWMAAIRAAFPRQRAGDVRYTEAAHGLPGSPLRAAYVWYVATREAWELERATFVQPRSAEVIL